MKNRRLAVVSGNIFGVSSWQTHTARIWRELAQEFDAVHVIARSAHQGWERHREGSVVLDLIPMGHRRALTFFFSSWLILLPLRRARPTHIIAQSPVYGGPAAIVYGWFLRVPVMVEIHGDHYLRPGAIGDRVHRWFFRPVARWTLSRAALIRSLGPGMTEEIGNVFGEHIRGKVVEIPTRVDVHLFSRPKESYSIPNRPIRVACVGSLTARKNQLGLLGDLEDAGVDCEVLLVGSGPDEQAIRERECRYTRVRVDLCGQVTHAELVDLLASVDVYVHYSRSEAAPRAILEAMAMGLPVVAAPAGYLAGIVDDGETGVLLDSFGADALRKAFGRLADESTRERMGSAARRRVVEQHEWNEVFARLHAALRSLDR